MKNIAIINALGISRYAFEPLSDGTTAFNRAFRFGSELNFILMINFLMLPNSSRLRKDTASIFYRSSTVSPRDTIIFFTITGIAPFSIVH